MLYQIGEFSELIGVSIQTLRNWDASGKLKPHTTTSAGVRHYSSEQLEQYAAKNNVKTKEKAVGLCYMYENEDISVLAEKMKVLKNFAEKNQLSIDIKTTILYFDTPLEKVSYAKELYSAKRVVLLDDSVSFNTKALIEVLNVLNIKVDVIPYQNYVPNTVTDSSSEGIVYTNNIFKDIKQLIDLNGGISEKTALELSSLLLEAAHNK